MKQQDYAAELRTNDKTIIGYFKADDVDVDRNPDNSQKVNGKTAAMVLCDQLNSTWNLSANERFYPRAIGTAKRYRDVSKPTLTRKAA